MFQPGSGRGFIATCPEKAGWALSTRGPEVGVAFIHVHPRGGGGGEVFVWVIDVSTQKLSCLYKLQTGSGRGFAGHVRSSPELGVA